jgi:predicted RNA binding protein YcfA (HicA-like mRNA interferase family)
MPSTISRRELIRKFRALGFEGPFSGGKHQFMVKSQKKIRIPNPHSIKDIHVSLVNEILKQAGISHDEWDRM